MSDTSYEKVIEFFRDISRIPRGSGNERGIADYLCAFAEENSLEFVRDSADNVFIKKPASPGLESIPPVLFQGHTDMVCEKDPGVEHDFLTDGLELEEKDGYLTAKGTTLGADDGIAVAMMMRLLTDEHLVHPAIECLFTTSEETGMNGAKAFDYSNISARTLINLDSEDFSEMIVSCAGGVRTDAVVETETMQFPASARKAVRVDIGGLAGGHSGADIQLGRYSALKLMGDLLAGYYEKEYFNILTVSGGTKDNAIAREATAVIAVADPDGFKKYVREFEKSAKASAVKEDKKLFVHVNKHKGTPEKMLTFACTSRLIDGMLLAPHGVLRMSPQLPGLVMTSTNFASVTDDNGRFKFTHLSRSSSEAELDAAALAISRLYKRIGAVDCEFRDRYPGWEYSGSTKIAGIFAKEYREVTGKDIEVKAIHAGLECGLISHNIPGMEIISVGPDIFDIHTPAERLKLDTVGALYKIVVRTLTAYVDENK